LLTLAACGGSDSSADTTAASVEPTATTSTAGSGDLVIGSVLYGVDGYQTQHGKAIEAYGQEIGVEVRNCNSENDVTKQQQCVQDFITAGVDGIILQPFEPAVGGTLVKESQDAGIPIITWAIGPVEDVPAVWIELSEYDQAKEAGMAAAIWVRENFDAAPLIVDLGIPNNTNCANRGTGFIDGAMEADPEAKVVAQPNGGGQRQVSADEMATVIDSGVVFNIVTGCNGESTLGALQSLRAAGRGKATNKVPETEYLFSVDGTTAEVEELLDPTSPLMATLSLTPYDNVRVLLDTMLKRVNGEIDDTYVGEVRDVLLPPDCAAVSEILQVQYDTTLDCS